MGYRNDLVLELDTVADGSGQYTGVWIDTAGVPAVTVSSSLTSVTHRLELSQDGSTSYASYDISGSTQIPLIEYPLPARYFRVAFVSASANQAFKLTVRQAK